MTRHDHFWNLFTVAELNKKISIKKFLIDVGDGSFVFLGWHGLK